MTPAGWPTPSSVRYHALALCLRVGGGTILPTRRRRGRSTPAPVPRTDGPSAPLTSTADDPRNESTAMETMEAHNQAVPTTTLTEETTEATTLTAETTEVVTTRRRH